MCVRWHRRETAAARSTNPARSLAEGPPVPRVLLYRNAPAAAAPEDTVAADLHTLPADPHFPIETGSLSSEKFLTIEMERRLTSLRTQTASLRPGTAPAPSPPEALPPQN